MGDVANSGVDDEWEHATQVHLGRQQLAKVTIITWLGGGDEEEATTSSTTCIEALPSSPISHVSAEPATRSPRWIGRGRDDISPLWSCGSRIAATPNHEGMFTCEELARWGGAVNDGDSPPSMVDGETRTVAMPYTDDSFLELWWRHL